MRKATALLIGVLMVGQLSLPFGTSPARADDSDIFGANIQPNVMIIIDDSGSMADSAPSNAFDQSTSYPILQNCATSGNRRASAVNCNSDYVYQSPSSTLYPQYATSISAVSSQSARNGLTQNGYWQGSIGGSNTTLYTGNYLNYLLGSCANGGACLTPKMDIAKRVVNHILDTVQGVRFGIMTFYYGSNGVRGARVVSQIGTSTSAMKNAVNNLSPTGDTPLGDSLYDAGQYFKGATLTDGTRFTTPIQLSCQPNFVILVTDGMQTSGSRTMPNEATLRFTQDHSTTLADLQNVIVDTVGFGTTVNTPQATSDQALADLAAAARNGGGQFYRSDSETDLEAALQDAIRRIVQATFTFATPVLPTTSTTGSTKAYIAAFRSDPSSPFWQGYLRAFQRDSNGVIPVDANGVPLASAQVWEAGQILANTPAANRTIYTVVNGTPVTTGSSTTTTGTRSVFDKTNATITQATLGVSSSAARDSVIDFIRGLDAYGANPSAERAWKLGDIFHSTPVLVTKPNRPFVDASYQTFKTANANRVKVLIGGANDGMLHAFQDNDDCSTQPGCGTELWAFIPPDLLDNLKTLGATSGIHDFYVDSSPIATDLKDSNGAWKTYVVFGLRRGGTTYYALDVTDTTNPIFKWSFTDTKMGETWSEPVIGKVKVGNADKFVAFVGGGYDTGTNNALGKALFVIDLATGQKLWEYYNDGSGGDRQYMNFSIAANATALDMNNDGYIDRVYIGDVGGQLWKFDVSSSTGPSAWTGKRLFAAAPSQTNPPALGAYYPAQGIYGAPSVAFDESMNLWVMIGTGDRNHPNNSGTNRFYGIKDTTSMANGATLTESDLANVTSSNIAATQGWYITLASSEKVLAGATIFNGFVFFSSFTPTSVVSCSSGGGTAKLYALQMETGFGGVDFATGQALPSANSSTQRSISIGAGIAAMPVIVVAYPAPGGSGTAVASAITGTTGTGSNSGQGGGPGGGGAPNNPVPVSPFTKQLQYWREVLR